jgi:hypothetical protein
MGSFIKPKISICETRNPNQERGYDIHVSKPYSVLGLYVLTQPVCALYDAKPPSEGGFNRNQNIKTYVKRKYTIENRFAARAN